MISLAGIKEFWTDLTRFSDQSDTTKRYRSLRAKIVLLMAMVTCVPLLLIGSINYHLYKNALERELASPLRTLVNKTRSSIEFFLQERLAAVSFIASAYTFDELSNPATLHRIFILARREFSGLVDLGLIDAEGRQVTYVGPHMLKDKDYSEQNWYHRARMKGKYVSDVFLGFRNLPHIVIAVEGRSGGKTWMLRATVDTNTFDSLLASMDLDSESQAFLVNNQGILQTNAGIYGKVLEKCPIPIPHFSYETTVSEVRGPFGREIVMANARIPGTDLIIMVLKSRFGLYQAWEKLRGELLFIFIIGVGIIFYIVVRLTSNLVRQVKDADQKREAAFKEMEHSHKLSSIGRLAAGVAHEINNPLAIINEKAGLLRDLFEHDPSCGNKEKYVNLVDRVLNSVDRCRTITHRLLGFARRMEVSIERLNVNDVVTEVLGFMEKEALYRKVEVTLDLERDLPSISSDRGQLQQVFLNILNNAFAAVDDGGAIVLSTRHEEQRVVVSIRDNGCGMSAQVRDHIFEPFFTTKGVKGTGLGMAITYGIVTKLGGEILVWSEENQGSEFTVKLPIA